VTEPRFRAFLRASLELVERETPRLSRALADHLGADALDVEVDGDRMSVTARGPTLAIDAQHGAAKVHIRTTTPAVRALLAGRASVIDAVLADEIELIGAAEDIARFDRALFLYLNATVRSPGHPGLMQRYLSSVE
jgi:hypothetical protein